MLMTTFSHAQLKRSTYIYQAGQVQFWYPENWKIDEIEKLLELFSYLKFSIKQIEEDIKLNIGKYLEEPWKIIGSYFEGQHLKQLVRHQVESYNDFVS